MLRSVPDRKFFVCSHDLDGRLTVDMEEEFVGRCVEEGTTQRQFISRPAES